MMKVISDDLRLWIHDACGVGEGTAEVDERFAISDRTVRRLKQRFREHGTLAELAAVAERPGDTPAEHRDRLGLPSSRRTVARAMRRLGLTYNWGFAFYLYFPVERICHTAKLSNLSAV